MIVLELIMRTFLNDGKQGIAKSKLSKKPLITLGSESQQSLQTY